jgi:RNA 2',3'-cyclic 3'-phosphodiesterase
MLFTGAPQQLSLNLGLRPKRPWSAPKFTQRTDLFFAIYLDVVAAARGAELARASCGPSQLSGRPRPAEILHVTLVPVGVASLLPTEAFSALARAAAVVDQAAFDVAFDRVASFKIGADFALVLLCDDGVAALTALRNSLHAAMACVGFRAPSRFTPHVTLAYCGKSVSETALDEPIAWTVREFVLVQSLTGRGVHVPLARWPLRG